MSTLVCNDIIKLEEAAQSHLPLEVLNPVTRLSNPMIFRDISEEELVFNEFIAERFTHHDGVKRKNIYHLNNTLDFSQMRGLREFYLKIKKSANKIHFIHKLQDLTEAYVSNFDSSTISCYKYIKDKPLIIESFNDAAYPFMKSDDCDIVICVSSNIILVFENKKYFKAIDLHEGKKSKLQLRVTDIFEPSLIKDKFLIQPLSIQERNEPEKLKYCYSKIIEKIVKDN
jgi:predicted P-loop ATPase/GTPase